MKEADKNAAIFESGPEAMKRNFAFHFEVQNFRDGTRGNMFVKTINPQ